MKLRAPDLPLDLEPRWPAISKAYAERVGKKEKQWAGDRFITRTNLVSTCLGKHIKVTAAHPLAKHSTETGDEDAFAICMRELRRRCRNQSRASLFESRWQLSVAASRPSQCARRLRAPANARSGFAPLPMRAAASSPSRCEQRLRALP